MGKALVMICEGCDIGASLDVVALERVARGHDGVAGCRTLPCLCNREGSKAIREGLEADATALVIAGCSPRFQPRLFSFEGYHTERVNLRELVVWSHEPKHEDTQMLAEDSLRMGIVRALKAEIPQPEPSPVERSLLVVGGGRAGLAAARGAARAGYRVVLVEKEAELGGWLRVWKRTLPRRAPYRDLEPSELDSLLREVKDEPNIEVHTGVRLGRISGQPGQFDVEIEGGTEKRQVRVGAIVQATGFRPYDGAKLSHLGYGTSGDVLTSVEFERLLAQGQLRRPSDGKRPSRIAFVQCAGSRDPAHLPYCSSVCCRVTLKQSLWARELEPACEVYVLAKDMRTVGLHEDFYRVAQQDPGISITKGEVTGVEPMDGGHLSVTLTQSQLGESVQLDVDLVILATGMVPVLADGEALRQLRDARKEVEKGGTRSQAAAEVAARLALHDGTEILQLSYRQGPDLPTLPDGLLDSHFTCFPYETRRTGIYAAGCVRAPNDLEGCRVDGEGAALKAIQAIEHAATGLAMHPRWGDSSLPRFALQRCTQCKRCTEECPFGTLDEDEKCTPRPNTTRCRRCGICLGACPERVVSFSDYSIDIVSSMIKAIHVPDEFEEKLRILVMLCENDAYPALDLAGFHRKRYSSCVRTITVRCLGAINVVWIADALARGFDGVLLLGCKPGEHTQCHFVRGSELMGTRSENVRQKLQQLALEDERVRVEHVALGDYLALPAVIDEFVKRIEAIGMNPFKGV